MLKYVLLFILWIIIGVIAIFGAVIKNRIKIDKMGFNYDEYYHEYIISELVYYDERMSRIRKFFLHGIGMFLAWPNATNHLCDIMDNALTRMIMDYAKQEESTT